MSNDAKTTLLDRLLKRIQATETQKGETLEIEFKSARGGFPKSAWETVSAFANTDGGWILLGISNKGDIEGLSNASQMLIDFYSTSRNPVKINYPVCGPHDARIENLDGKDIIIIRVPEMNRKQQPIFIDNNPYTGTYVRRHEGDHRCTKPEVNRMMREASEDGADSTIIPKFGLDDIDQDSLINYRQRYQILHPAEARNSYANKEFLTAIGGYKRDRSTGEEGLTVAGLLVLGTDASIRDWRSRHNIDYRLILNEDDPDTRWDDRILWEGNLLRAFEVIYPRLTKDLTTAFRLQGAVRSSESSVHVVLREALINLLVHADYAVPEMSLIKRTPSSFFFRNPGSSRIPVHELLNGDHSDPRNPEIVRMFRLIGLAEEAGSGIPRIIRAWHELGLEMPTIDTDTERYEFTLHLRQAHLLSLEDQQWLQSLGHGWSEIGRLALVRAKHYGQVDNATLTNLSGKHWADVSKELGGLRKQGFLEIIGIGRYAKYRLGPQSMPSIEVFTNMRKYPVQIQDISDELWNELFEIAAVVREQPSIDRSTLESTVVRLCSYTPLSLRELSILLNRKPEYLRQNIIAGLNESGRLEFLHPDQPKSRYQKYLSRTLNSNPSIIAPRSVADADTTDDAIQQSTIDLGDTES